MTSPVPALNEYAKSLGLPEVVGAYHRDGKDVFCIFARPNAEPYRTHDPEEVKAKLGEWAQRRAEKARSV